ncbi:MAG: hypothetical protein WD066_10960 [Planctomycetaceae bacterium]
MTRRINGSWKLGGALAVAIAGTSTLATNADAQFGPEPIEVRRSRGVSINLPFIRVRTGGGTAVDAPFVRLRTGRYSAPPPFAPYGPVMPDSYGPYAPYPDGPFAPLVPYGASVPYGPEGAASPDAPIFVPRADVPRQGVPIRVFVDSSAPVMVPVRKDGDQSHAVAEPTPIGGRAPIGGPVPAELGAPSATPLPQLNAPSNAPAPIVPTPAVDDPGLVIPPLPAPSRGAATDAANAADGEPEETVIKQRSAQKPPEGPAFESPVPEAPAQTRAANDDAVGGDVSGREVAGRVPQLVVPAAGEAAAPVAERPSYIVIPSAGNERVRIGPIAAGQAAPEGTTEYELAPMPHTDVPAYFEPQAGTHLFAFLHPRTGGTVAVEVALPEGRPRLDVAADRVTFDYSRGRRVTIHFPASGGARVAHGR